MPQMIYLGKTAKYLRERKGLSQRVAAEALGITQVHLSNIENNKAMPSARLLSRYREVWGVDLYVLAWCLDGDANRLPESVKQPMQELARAWKRELGDLTSAMVGG
jgi:transcriptional regulator with XRE-family HTH domain